MNRDEKMKETKESPSFSDGGEEGVSLNSEILDNEGDISQNSREKNVYIETYGCQMNVSDSEIIASVLTSSGYCCVAKEEDARIVLLNTCAIRSSAERTIHHRLRHLRARKKKEPNLLVGVMGCMAERMKKALLEEENLVDMVVGPDAYRHLPSLLKESAQGVASVNTFLSREETYADISPIRLYKDGITAFISIMRGCDNMCSFCVVPFTRGRERSRSITSIVKEATDLWEEGYREVTLLGQNVDSYMWSEAEGNKARLQQRLKTESLDVSHFEDVLSAVAEVHTSLRVRFSTSHPKDMSEGVLAVMSRHDNICNHIHLPIQSGHSAVLSRMNRGYSREGYLELVGKIRNVLGERCSLTTDIITGFCGESEAEHASTLSLMEEVCYDSAFMFIYSERPGTLAQRRYKDDVSYAVKQRRLEEIISVQKACSVLRYGRYIGKEVEVLVEGFSKRSSKDYQGRTRSNKVVVFPTGKNYGVGDYVIVKIVSATSATLLGGEARKLRGSYSMITDGYFSD